MRLNEGQAVAAHAGIDAAQKVVAGAGTGKTATMVARFVHLVAEHGLDPTRIIAVTFTNKAAGELRSRITDALIARELITDSAQLDTAWIGTFHTLCLRLLREHCYTVGFDRDTRVVEPLAERLLITEIQEALLDGRIDGAGVDALEALDVDNVVKLATDTFDFIRRMKGRGIGPDDLAARCDSGYTAWWVNGDGDLVDAATEAAAEREAQAMICATFLEYERRLDAARVIDFDGIVLRTLRALREHPAWAASLREWFHYVIVDEYQDTSQSQAAVIRLLARDNLANVSVVGDPRQSIYGWRDADISNLLGFAGAERILDVNYRSHQEILDLAHAVITVDPTFDDPAPMAAHDEHGPRVTPDGLDPVVLALANDVEDEARWVAANIRRVHDHKGAAWSDIALLTRLRVPPIAFERALRDAGIPYVTGGGYGFFGREEVKDVLALLAVVENPLNDRALVRLLQSPATRVSDAALYTLVRGRLGVGRTHRHPWDAVMEAEADDFPELDLGVAQRVRACLALVRSLQDMRAGMSVRDIVQQAIDRSGAAARAAADPTESDRRTGNLRKLVRLAGDYEASAVFSGIAEFLRYVELHEAHAIEEPEADDVDADAVRFTTVHAAKGLEFPYVFLAYVSPARRQHRGLVFLDDALGLIVRKSESDAPTTKFDAWTKRLGRDRPTDIAAREYRRIIYVAITRAQTELYVSATRRDQPTWDDIAVLPKLQEPEDDFFVTIAEYAGKRGWPRELASLAVAPAAGATARTSHDDDVARIPLPERCERPATGFAERTRIELSHTQLEVMAQCPLRYRYLFDWRVPVPPDDLWPDSARHQNAIAASELGDLVHRTLQACHPRGHVTLSLDTIRARWDVASRGVLTDTAAADVWAREGEAMFVNYLASPVSAYETVATEQEFNLAVDVGGVPVMIRGFIDRLCRTDDGRLLVVDYKTNRDISTATHAAHDRQLAIYTRAVTDALGFDEPVDACVLALRTGERIDGRGDAWDDVGVLLSQVASDTRGAPERPPCSGCAFRDSCPASVARRR